jgi:hypothetical protein
MSTSFLFLMYFILFKLVIEVKSQKNFLPLKRTVHTATFVNNILYILGGFALPGTLDKNETVGQQFFYLDLSKPFYISDIAWIDLSYIPLIPPHARAAVVRDGDKLILYGGTPIPSTREMGMVYSFDTENLSWSFPELNGNYFPFKKSSLTPVISNNKMYLYGGFLYDKDKYDQGDYAGDMAILDTVNFSFSQGSSTNAPTPRGYFGAVLLQNQKILYIGKKKSFPFFKKKNKNKNTILLFL